MKQNRLLQIYSKIYRLLEESFNQNRSRPTRTHENQLTKIFQVISKNCFVEKGLKNLKEFLMKTLEKINLTQFKNYLNLEKSVNQMISAKV